MKRSPARPLLVVVDTETTGLGHTRGRPDGIVQIGYAYRDPVEGMVRTWSSLCNPGVRFLKDGRAAEAFRVNGRTEEEVRAAPRARTVASTFRRYLSELRARHGELRLAAYNLDFDRPFLAAAPWRIEGPWSPCIMRAAHARLRLSWKWPRLEEACRALGIPWPGDRAHDAGEDAHAALLVSETLEHDTFHAAARMAR